PKFYWRIERRKRHHHIPILQFFFFQAEDGIRDGHVTGVQTCALPIFSYAAGRERYDELLEIEGVIPAPYMARIFWVAVERWDVRSEERRVGKECRCRWGP